MFIDETTISVKAGNGGKGCFSYHREKFIPMGKPNGGNGGRGANIIFKASTRVQTLQDVSYNRFYKAEIGGAGGGKDMYGAKGKDTIILVPVGTIVKDLATDEILHDFTIEDEEVTIAHGGRGGRGNAALRNRNNPNPDYAEEGMPGDEFELRLILKVMADIGLVGHPNAGKSTLLSTISKAHPKIADYPFTTLEPNLGIVKFNHLDSFVMADIPGIIEGAHEGKGLGIRFLKHIERTRILSIMVAADSEDPEKEAEELLNELRLYSSFLAEKPKIFVMTKIDMVPADELKIPKGWHGISSVTRTGTDELILKLNDLLESIKEPEVRNIVI